MINATQLASSLSGLVGVAEPKQANAFTQVETPLDNQGLQEIIGDPDTQPLSWSAQFKPSTGDSIQPDPGSPLGGDEVFMSGLIDGAKFQDHAGKQWQVESYDYIDQVMVRSVWYPRIFAIISLSDLRGCIHSWIEPFLQRVPPLPSGISYGVLDVKVAK